MLSLVGARMDFEAECLAFPAPVLVGPPGIRTRTRFFKHPSPVTRAGTRFFKHTSPATRTDTRFSKLHGHPCNGLLRKLEPWQSRVTPSPENPATTRDNSAETTFALSQVRIPPPPHRSDGTQIATARISPAAPVQEGDNPYDSAALRASAGEAHT